MGSIVRSSVQFRLLVLAVAAGVFGLGLAQLRGAPVDVLPEFTPPYAEVQTEALGLSAEEVEQLITVPLEADLLNGVEGIEVIRSESVPGLSSIVMVFQSGTDIYQARQLIQERLTQAHALPNVSKPPTLLQPLSSSNRVLLIGMRSDRVSAIEQSVIARWTVRPRLLGVPGVANVSVWGMRDQQLQVQVDPERLQEQGVTLNQIVRSAGNAQVVSPLTFLEASTPGTGGFIETPQQRLQVRHLIEKIADPEALGKVPVDGTNGRLRLADVADISVDHQPLIGDAVVAGGSGLVLVVEKFPGADTVKVTEAVEDALEALAPGLTGIETDTSFFRPASYIAQAADNLWVTFAIGAGLLLLVLLVLQLRWRTVVVAVVTVPAALVVAGLLLKAMGQTFNAIALAGLGAGLAIVVDEAVAASEQARRRLRERAETAASPSTTGLVTRAFTEARRPLTYAGLILALVALPVAVMAGRPGAFFRPMVLGYLAAVVAATLVAVTVAPALASLLAGRGRQPDAEPEPWLSAAVARGHANLFRRLSGGMRGALAISGLCLALGLAALPFLDVALVPRLQDRDLLVRLEAAPGTSNTRMTELTREVARRVEGVPGVRDVGAHVGRAVTGDRVTNVSSSDVWATVADDANYDRTVAAIRAAARNVDGVRSDVVTYSTQKLRDVGALVTGENRVRGAGLNLLTGADKPLVVRVFGEDYEVLRQEAARVQDLLRDVPGVVRPQVELPPAEPTVEIEVDLDKARTAGLTPGDVRRAEATLIQGIQVGSVFQEQKVFDVIVQGTPETRSSVESVQNLLIDRPGGGQVRLGDVAEVRVAETPAVIRRDSVSRRLDVIADVRGRALGDVVTDVRNRLSALSFPLEYHAEVIEQRTADEAGVARMAGFGLAALAAMFLLLQAAFRSWRLAALVMAALPLCLAGGVLTSLVAGAELSAGVLLGLLATLTVATRAALSLSCRLQERDTRVAERRAEELRLAATESALPIVASAAALAALVAPAAVLGARPGLELLQPMAVVLLGGLVTTLVVTLLVLPTAYLHLVPPFPGIPEEELAWRLDLESAARGLPRQREGSATPSEREPAP